MLARAISTGISPSAAATMAMSSTGSHEAALDAWVDAVLSRSRLDAESRLTKLAVSCAVLSAVGSHRVLPYAEEGALFGALEYSGRIVIARTARFDAEEPPPGSPMRMVALVATSAGAPRQPRLERIYDTKLLSGEDPPPVIALFGNFNSFAPPSPANVPVSPVPSLPRTPPVVWPQPKPPTRIAIGIAELTAAAIISGPELHGQGFHVPTLSSIERRFVPELQMPEWAWNGLDEEAFAAEDDVVRLPLTAANEWAVRTFNAEHRRRAR